MPQWPTDFSASRAHIRVIAPSRSLSIVNRDQAKRALMRLENRFEVSFSRGALEQKHMDGPRLATRLDDINSALEDATVNIIMSAIGGYSCAELLPYLDYKQIGISGKLFCGFSDVSVLLNNVALKAQVPALHGPHFASFGHPTMADQIEVDFLRALTSNTPYELRGPARWGDDTWHINDEWETYTNHGPRCLRPGTANGVAVGGNVVSLVGNLPSKGWPECTIIFLEIHRGFEIFDFMRWVGSVLRAAPPGTINGVLIGKLPVGMSMSSDEECQLTDIIGRHTAGPIILDADFGHNVPSFSFPIGGKVSMEASRDGARVLVL